LFTPEIIFLKISKEIKKNQWQLLYVLFCVHPGLGVVKKKKFQKSKRKNNDVRQIQIRTFVMLTQSRGAFRKYDPENYVSVIMNWVLTNWVSQLSLVFKWTVPIRISVRLLTFLIIVTQYYWLYLANIFLVIKNMVLAYKSR
jgi:hypothetical protein